MQKSSAFRGKNKTTVPKTHARRNKAKKSGNENRKPKKGKNRRKTEAVERQKTEFLQSALQKTKAQSTKHSG